MRRLLGDLWDPLAQGWNDVLGLDPQVLELLLETCVVLLFYVIFYLLVRRLVNNKFDDVARRYTARRTATYILGFLALMAVMRIWVRETGDLLTFIGLLSAGLAVALQDPITNLAACSDSHS